MWNEKSNSSPASVLHFASRVTCPHVTKVFVVGASFIAVVMVASLVVVGLSVVVVVVSVTVVVI